MAASAFFTEPEAAARWLYRFGTLPHTPAIDRDFGPDDDPMAVLGLTIGGRARRLLEAAYEPTSFQGWYSFARPVTGAPFMSACKLYVSPRPEALADAFPRIAAEFVRLDVRSFKVGRGAEGLLRPDKLIAYFDDHDHMHAVAVALEDTLRGCPAQGVPFTTESGGDGLLSWGVDPPLGNAAASWRSWVTKRLAARLTAPRATVEGVLAGMRQTGVDPETWRPSADAFREESAQ